MRMIINKQLGLNFCEIPWQISHAFYDVGGEYRRNM